MKHIFVTLLIKYLNAINFMYLTDFFYTAHVNTYKEKGRVASNNYGNSAKKLYIYRAGTDLHTVPA